MIHNSIITDQNNAPGLLSRGAIVFVQGCLNMLNIF